MMNHNGWLGGGGMDGGWMGGGMWLWAVVITILLVGLFVVVLNRRSNK